MRAKPLPALWLSIWAPEDWPILCSQVAEEEEAPWSTGPICSTLGRDWSGWNKEDVEAHLARLVGVSSALVPLVCSLASTSWPPAVHRWSLAGPRASQLSSAKLDANSNVSARSGRCLGGPQAFVAATC